MLLVGVVVVDVFTSFYRLLFSHARSAPSTSACYPFSSHLRGQGMAAQRDAFPADWDTCGIVTLFILLFSSSRVCPLVNIFLVAVNRPAHPALTFPHFSLLQMDDVNVTRKKEANDPTRFISFRFS